MSALPLSSPPCSLALLRCLPIVLWSGSLVILRPSHHVVLWLVPSSLGPARSRPLPSFHSLIAVRSGASSSGPVPSSLCHLVSHSPPVPGSSLQVSLVALWSDPLVASTPGPALALDRRSDLLVALSPGPALSPVPRLLTPSCLFAFSPHCLVAWSRPLPLSPRLLLSPSRLIASSPGPALSPCPRLLTPPSRLLAPSPCRLVPPSDPSLIVLWPYRGIASSPGPSMSSHLVLCVVHHLGLAQSRLCEHRETWRGPRLRIRTEDLPQKGPEMARVGDAWALWPGLLVVLRPGPPSPRRLVPPSPGPFVAIWPHPLVIQSSFHTPDIRVGTFFSGTLVSKDAELLKDRPNVCTYACLAFILGFCRSKSVIGSLRAKSEYLGRDFNQDRRLFKVDVTMCTGTLCFPWLPSGPDPSSPRLPALRSSFSLIALDADPWTSSAKALRTSRNVDGSAAQDGKIRPQKMAQVGDAQSPLAWSPRCPLTRSPHLPIARSPGRRPLAPTARRRPPSTARRPIAPSRALTPPPRRPLAPSPHLPVPSSLVAPLHRLPVAWSLGPLVDPSGSNYSSSSSLDPSSPCHPIARSRPSPSPSCGPGPSSLVAPSHCRIVALSHHRIVSLSPHRLVPSSSPFGNRLSSGLDPHRLIAPSHTLAPPSPSCGPNPLSLVAPSPRLPVAPSPGPLVVTLWRPLVIRPQSLIASSPHHALLHPPSHALAPPPCALSHPPLRLRRPVSPLPEMGPCLVP
ncbi:hypothetical protein BC826DRAFT_1109739 [Russula brevipes]|nr:hypothetical protein BC826DRAFT_1109739 [Russula brevipes]